MPSSARLTWLHLSDFHLREELDWSQDVVLKSMLEDILARYAGSNRPDLLFLTGDIAFSGKPEEYDLAENFVIALCDGLKLDRERMCIIPGNHDVDLDREEDAFNGARQGLRSASDVDRLLGNEGRRKTLFMRQAAYRDFVNRVIPHHPGSPTSVSYAHSRAIRVGALRVRVLLIDSAWLAQGGTEDLGGLLVGERQVLECIGSGALGGACLTIALMHHPFAWLRDFEQLAIENLVVRESQVLLRGHVHRPDARSMEVHQGRLVAFTAGAAFQARTSDNSYMWCSFELATGGGEQVVHRYDHVGHRWDASEPARWQLVARPPPISDVAAGREHLIRLNARYPLYVTALLADFQAEVPVRLQNHKVTFLGLDADAPGLANPIGQVIRQLRFHFHWEAVWEAAGWEAELRRLIGELDQLLAGVEADIQAALAERERSGRAILATVCQPEQKSIAPVLSEIRCLLADGNVSQSRFVINRWRGQDVLEGLERLELDRLEIMTLLAEGNAPGAAARSAALLGDARSVPSDLALAARCHLDAKEFDRAAKLMHEALDKSVRVEEVRTLALRIAGAAGDKRLVGRVKP